MTFNIADARVSALLLSWRVSDALHLAERLRQQAAHFPGRLNYSVLPCAALGAGRLHTACVLLEQAAEGLSASGHAIGRGYRYHVPCVTGLAIRGSTGEAAAALAALDQLRRTFRLLDYERSLAPGMGGRRPGRRQ